MCGRYVIYDQLTQGGVNLLGHDIPANFNVAPTMRAPIIRLAAGTRDQELLMARWGLLPNWAKHLKIPPFFNARAENLEGNKVFWPSITQRCLVPMSGFYEWSMHDKQPYYIHLKPQKLFYTAGLWNRWQLNAQPAIDSYTIITTASNALLTDIHHRMPVILNTEGVERWLNQPFDQARAVLQTCDQRMDKYPAAPRQPIRVDERV